MSSNGNKSFLRSVFGMNCPRCREGSLFGTSSFSFQEPFNMHKSCPNCSQDFMPEPGFYYGAMFISYTFWGLFSILLCLSLIFVFDWSINGAFALLIFFSLLLFVWTFRISRSLWIHINIKFRKEVQ